MKNFNRRNFLIATSGVLLSASGVAWYKMSQKPTLGFEATHELIKNGKDLLEKIIAIDIHAHPGRSFVENADNIATKFYYYSIIGRFEDEAIVDIKKGNFVVANFSTVSDYQLLGLGDKGLYARREFSKDEAWNSYKNQIATLKKLHNNKNITPVLKPQDIITAKKTSTVGAMFSAEGADFLQGSVERLEHCYQDGIRSITLMHYHNNKVGDIQTQAPQHNTLSPIGISLVKKMNELGIIVDLAHAEKNTLRKALEVTDKPVMVSHTLISKQGSKHPRFIEAPDARRVASNGGIIGAWPAGITLKTLSDYIDEIFRMIDIVGIEHVAIGSDMDANYKPVFYNYDQAPLLAGSLLERGLNEYEAEKILGGNFLRIFKEVSS